MFILYGQVGEGRWSSSVGVSSLQLLDRCCGCLLSVGQKGSHVPVDYFFLEVFVSPLKIATVVSGAL